MHRYKLSRPRRLAAVTFIGTGLFAMSGFAHAQTQAPAVEEPHPVDQSQWGLGIGVGSENHPYRGVTKRTSVLPLVLYESRTIHLFGNAIDFKLPSPSDEFTFTLRAKYDFGGGYKASDSANLQGMEDRNGGLWGGATATWDNRFAKLSTEWLTAGSSKGSTVKLSAEHAFVLNGRFKLTWRISSTWMNSKYVDYYYGVRANEVTADRAAYVGTSTSNVEGGLRADYALSKNQLLLLDISDIHRGNGITNSPIVDKSSSLGIKMGYLYKF